MAKSNEGKSKKVQVGVGVGVTAALLSAAGAYFLYGSKNAEKNRKQVKSWSLKAKAEVLDTLEKAKSLSREDYEQLIDKTVKTYSKVKTASAPELVAFAKEMKAHWKMLEKKGGKQATEGKAAAKKAIRKAKKVIEEVAAEAGVGGAEPAPAKKAAKRK